MYHILFRVLSHTCWEQGYHTRPRLCGVSSDLTFFSGTPSYLLSRIWYRYCLLSLLLPFVRDASSLGYDGQQPADEYIQLNVDSLLPGGATPFSVCNESSEALIILASNYRSKLSTDHMSPLLPYMLFAAVLYRLTLVVNPPPNLNPPAETHSASSAAGIPNARASHPTVVGYPQFNLHRERCRAIYLIELGSQVLESFGEHHSGAASAAHMLRSLGPVPALEASLSLSDMADRLPALAGVFTRSVMSTVFGYAASPQGAG